MTQISIQPQGQRYRTVLSVAGSDSGGGAGIQADIKTISALGCYATTAITALTAQNTTGVQAVYPVSPEFLRQQIDSVFQDIGADAVKIGMFASLENLDIIRFALKRYGAQQVVFDPVMMSSSGASLVFNDSVRSLSQTSSEDRLNTVSHFSELSGEKVDQALISNVLLTAELSSLFTPNLLEVEFLTKSRLRNIKEAEEAGREFNARGVNAVLIKGGHWVDANGYPSATVTDLLIQRNVPAVIFESPRLKSNNLHGTGCTLSSAIASYLAKGLGLEEAVRRGREFLTQAIKSGSGVSMGGQQFSLGSFAGPGSGIDSGGSDRSGRSVYGSGPLNHGFNPQPTDFKAIDE